ncbi:Halocyanin [uncultured archaeon]|nr:Halocyanin [uncultured archaeon]
MSNKKFIFSLALAVLAFALFFGCTQGGYTAQTNNQANGNNTTNQDNNVVTSSNPQNYAVNISNFAFNPAEVTINKGDTVSWLNSDSSQHTVTSDTAGLFDSGFLAKGASFQHTFNEAGTYTYHCSVHPSMSGKIIVQ